MVLLRWTRLRHVHLLLAVLLLALYFLSFSCETLARQMLAKEESLFPAMYANMRRAFVPLMDENAYEAMRKTSDMVCWGFPPVQLFSLC